MERLKRSPAGDGINERQPSLLDVAKISFTPPDKDKFWSINFDGGPEVKITLREKQLVGLLMENDGNKRAEVDEILVRIFPGASDPKKADLYTAEAVRLLIIGVNRKLQGSGLVVDNIGKKKKKKKRIYALVLANPGPGR